MDTMKEDLLKSLECPVCFEYMLPPITMCCNGHNICNTCKASLQHCPTCRGDLLDVRNRTVEDISRTIEHPCKFQKSRCNRKFRIELKEEHENVCCYGPHKCPFYISNECHWEGPFENVRKHMETTHTSTISTVRGKMENFFPDYGSANGRWRKVVFTLDKVFFRHAVVTEKFNYICCMYVGSREDNNNYKYAISIKSPDGKEVVSSCRKCPHYLDCIGKDVPYIKSAAFPMEFTNQCVNKEGQLEF